MPLKPSKQSLTKKIWLLLRSSLLEDKLPRTEPISSHPLACLASVVQHLQNRMTMIQYQSSRSTHAVSSYQIPRKTFSLGIILLDTSASREILRTLFFLLWLIQKYMTKLQLQPEWKMKLIDQSVFCSKGHQDVERPRLLKLFLNRLKFLWCICLLKLSCPNFTENLKVD